MTVRDWRRRAATIGMAAAVSLALAGCATMEAGGPSVRAAPVVTEAVAHDAVEAWVAAVVSGDAARVGDLLAPEFQIQRADGRGYDRDAYLAQGLPSFSAMPPIEVIEATSGAGLLVVRYALDSPPGTRFDGNPTEGWAPRLTVFRWDGSRWLVSGHANFVVIGGS